ncbi:unnamed protein product [marine sediment metagenome]|uniref:Uncharacterized protein n=1 Tax=marine sediment metagenome TaxID=412755 RepID=X1GSY3_9ZZZZ
MEQNSFNIHANKNGNIFRKKIEKKYPETIYVNMQLMIDKYMRPWVDNFEKAFKLLDEANEYNIVILLKADSCVVEEKSIKIQNLKKTMIVDK